MLGRAVAPVPAVVESNDYIHNAVTDFAVRPMKPTDGPAIDDLMRTEAQSTAVSLTTHYLHDVYEALLAQHPTLFGVVAEVPGINGLVGVATAFLDEMMVGGHIYPAVHLENLKVHHAYRRRGLGTSLAKERIDEARRLSGPDTIVTAGVEASNTASLATARGWSTQVLGPVRIVVGRTSTKAPELRDVEIRPLADTDIGPLVEALSAFYADHDMVPRQTPAGVAASLNPTRLGFPIRAYRVATDRDGTLVAGAGITERYKLMADHIDAMPLPVALLGRVTGLLPADRFIRSIELSLAWHARGRVDALRHLWDAIRFEWRDRATNIVALADPRGSLIDAFPVGRTFAPRIELMAPVQSPILLDPNRLLYMWR